MKSREDSRRRTERRRLVGGWGGFPCDAGWRVLRAGHAPAVMHCRATLSVRVLCCTGCWGQIGVVVGHHGVEKRMLAYIKNNINVALGQNIDEGPCRSVAGNRNASSPSLAYDLNPLETAYLCWYPMPPRRVMFCFRFIVVWLIFARDQKSILICPSLSMASSPAKNKCAGQW